MLAIGNLLPLLADAKFEDFEFLFAGCCLIAAARAAAVAVGFYHYYWYSNPEVEGKLLIIFRFS